MTLKEKLLAVMQECAHIGKDAVNDEVGYPYVSAAKINDAINSALTKNRIVTTAETEIKEFLVNGDFAWATVEATITLHDVDSEETLAIRGAGEGIDKGDKAIAKAQTMAIKYAWKNTLHIADSSDDPDAVADKVQYKGKKPALKNFVAPF